MGTERSPLSQAMRAAAALGSVMLLGGCVVGPNFEQPEVAVLQNWSEGAGFNINQAGITGRGADYAAWWTLFQDPVLGNLVVLAYKQNVGIEAAGVKVYEARAQLGIARGNYFPQQQQVGGGYKRTRISTQESFLEDVEKVITIDPIFDRWDTGFDAAWEIDLWGKIRRGNQSAAANLLAQIANYDDALVTIAGEVASTYVTIRELQQLIDISRRNAALQRRSLDLANDRLEAGVTTDLDVSEATVLYNDTLAAIPRYEAALAQAKNAMSVLLSEPPGGITWRLAGSDWLPRVPAEIAIGVPADLLRRRPDIRAAEYMAAAQAAQVGVAVADLYPAFGISGAIGVKASDFSGLFTQNAITGFINPGFTWNFLNYGRIRNNVRVQDAQYEELILNYKNTVLTAYSEVETALVAFLKAKQEAVYLARSVEAAKKAVDVVIDQYTDGTAEFGRVIFAERALLRGEERLLNARTGALTNLISVYKGLGGGWQAPNVEGFVSDETKTQMADRTNWGRLLDQPVLPVLTAATGPGL
jgi:NodT family efflux transporter outer membrane factor (OMF) lipoprotein